MWMQCKTSKPSNHENDSVLPCSSYFLSLFFDSQVTCTLNSLLTLFSLTNFLFIQFFRFCNVYLLVLSQFIFRSHSFCAAAMATVSSGPRTVEEIFKDYSARRAGIIRALTFDVDEFYGLCDPEKENLCLYGHPNETWEVNLPAEEVPPELPEPALGINFARDGMNRRDWLSLIAVHSDCWLLSVAFYLGARLNRNERKRLFSMINDLPTAFEVVTERKPVKDKPNTDSGSRSRGSTKRSSDGQAKSNPKLADEGYDEDEDEHSETLCGSCGGNYNADEFWIGCDICERWYHGKCVKITPAKAENIKQYKCPSCFKRGRQ